MSVDKLPQWWVVRGLALLGLGIVAITAPLVAAEWALALLGLYLTTAGLLNLLQAWLVGDWTSSWSTYVEGVLMTLAGVLVFFRPLLLLSGLLVIVAVALLVDGAIKLVSAIHTEPGRARGWIALGGVVNVGLAVIVWTLRGSFSTLALGLVVGFYLLSQAWSTLLAPPEGMEAESLAEATNTHPDAALGLTPHADLGRRRAEAIAATRAQAPIDRYWMLTLVLVFMAIHVGRMDASLTWLGLISPAVAVGGDLLVALVLGAGLVMPMRLWCRKLARPLEAAAWRHRLSTDARRVSIADQLMHKWLDARLGFAVRLRLARGSLLAAAHMAFAAGLPLTVMLVAMNPIWGFTWYFNTENWASGVWEKITEIRVDHWREAMVRAVHQAQTGVGADSLALFDVHPEGVDGSEDFSFLVVGDPGEGDASQYVLHDRYVEIGHRPEVKFLVVSSDVIYPSGEMKDYEFNFYLPLKGFEKPVYAIPGNHDWYNALNGFLANFLEPDAARVAIAARVVHDFGHGMTADEQTRYLVDEAARLRRAYGIRTGEQRAPFFALRTGDFTLLAVDTGILRAIDSLQRMWLEDALKRARGTFTMVLLGHPLYAGGVYQAVDGPFAAIHQLLRDHEVPLVMAGDTHDFEYYREAYQGTSGTRVMHHVVNGGGGAFLSIGTALDWPIRPAVADWAFYPRTDALQNKLAAETPWWKRPIWWWVHRLRAWPASVEALSGSFDFNRAPFFQSFMEVGVERSRRQVRLRLHGVHGPLRWRDLQTGGSVVPPGQGPDDPVELIMRHTEEHP